MKSCTTSASEKTERELLDQRGIWRRRVQRLLDACSGGEPWQLRSTLDLLV
jgi:hypothetical protein